MSKSNMFPGTNPVENSRSLENDAERIEKNAESIQSKVYAGRKLAPFFQVEVTLRLFGEVIFSWVFPPKKS